MEQVRRRTQIWLVAAAVALAVSTTSVWQLVASRQSHLDAAKQLVLSLTYASAERIAGTLRSIDVMLVEASEQVRDPHAIDPETLVTYRTKLSAFPEIDALGFVDAQGKLLVTTRLKDGKLPVDVSDRPNFIFQRAHYQERTTHVTAPVQDRLTGRTVFLVSRPLVGNDGSFKGVVTAVVVPRFMTEALSSVVQSEGGAAAAFTPDGMLYGRQPQDERFVGKSIADSALYRAFADNGHRAGTSELARSFSDGIERVVAFAPIANFPVVAAVGVNRATVLADWQREAVVHGGLQSLLVTGIFLLAWGLSRSEDRREKVTERLLATERSHVERLAQAVADRTHELNKSLMALSESEERFRRMVDISPFPLVLTRITDGLVVYINACAAEAFLVEQHDAPGKIAPDFWEDPADRTRMIESLAKTGELRNMEAVLTRANGERFTAILSATRAWLQGEELLLVAVMDITERKKLEEDLGRSNRDLEQFSYAVSHDLQEPLRMVSSYLALLERRYGESLDESAREFIGFAVDGAQRMSRMITDLLEYSRVHRKGNRFAPVALDEVLGEALANLHTALADAGGTVDSQPLPTVLGDASQLMRIFQNLVGNALKYRNPDRPPRIAITARHQGGEWVIAVADNGIGIDPAHMDRLFQVFQRLHPRGTYEGTGVGLALCRRIVERHGGRIWVESEGEGKGSTFIFTLPGSEG